MNIQSKDILKILNNETFVNQRILAETSGYSLGTVNSSLKELVKDGYLNDKFNLTLKAIDLIKENSPSRAIILAAGFGMRMVPINTEMPKGLLEVKGECLIERIIKQLHEVGIKEIYVVVGFMKERYEYLIDEYGVKLVVNKEYANKNNLYSLSLVKDKLENSYIVPCDIWCKENPFSNNELYSWYMVSNLLDSNSNVRINRKRELVLVNKKEKGNSMIGISYLVKEDAEIVSNRLKELCNDSDYDDSFWEEALFDEDKMIVSSRLVSSNDFVEIIIIKIEIILKTYKIFLTIVITTFLKIWN